MDGVVIAGTGTDVGKTVIASALLRLARAADMDAVPMKPVQTGATLSGDGWRAPDLEAHLAAAGLEPDPETRRHMAPYCYEPACSPHLAAQRTNRPYADVDAIVASACWLGERHDTVVVELAGGVLVPLSATQTNRDVIVALELPVVVVADAGLGGINHALLTLESLAWVDARVLGVIWNEPRPRAGDDYIIEDNPRITERIGGVPVLGAVPFCAGDIDAIAGHITGRDRIIEALRRSAKD